ncbi:formate dehydrogenase [Sphingomonas cavernae]|uniref:Formate dehydrogenase n=2 Tax=Sphingomonas cavernae TaxID=2320861 RepID=A0A418WNC2_9SPHN|nr:formate dehydrogenase subunit delta [Sphingomonas cavernae]RJF91503.1 formate dehydrogenase [Sphingomonas cavernae]
MANQIARNLATQGPDEAAHATADHILRYWDPRMKAMILAYDGDALDAIARAAIEQIRQPA